jgi:hypothetical protein
VKSRKILFLGVFPKDFSTYYNVRQFGSRNRIEEQTMMSIRSLSYAVVAICSLPGASIAIADVQVVGEVLVDGKPLATGKITFYQRDGQFVGGPVKNGQYSIEGVAVGMSIVTIEGKGLARRYTARDSTELQARLVKNVPNTMDFHLVREDRGAPLPEDDPLLQAIARRFGEPDYVKVNGRFMIRYDLRNGDWLTLVVSDGKVIGIEHATIE